jgi:hypothetical protein
MMFCDRNEKDDDGECQRQRNLAADKGAPEKRNPTQLRNEASLNCVSLRSELDCEVSCEVVKGQDERRRSAAPLTTSHPADQARMQGRQFCPKDPQDFGAEQARLVPACARVLRLV